MSQNLGDQKGRPLVSVCVVTYNHAPYIRECLDSILKQETDFPYEICVGEDESPDGTREICQEYAEKYSDKIRLFVRSREDVISINGRPTGRFNFLETIKACRGKYIAICEGDDYWHNPDKLQKQVDFMEAHPEYSMCHTEHDNFDMVQGRFIKNRWKVLGFNHDVDVDEIAPLVLADQYVVSTCTVLARSDYVHEVIRTHAEDFDQRYMMADSQMWFYLARMGNVKYFEESMATYRRIPNSATAVNDYKNRFVFIKNVYWARRSFAERYSYDGILARIDRIYLNQLVCLSILTGAREATIQYAERLTNCQLWDDKTCLLQRAVSSRYFSVLYILSKYAGTSRRKGVTFISRIIGARMTEWLKTLRNYMRRRYRWNFNKRSTS